MTEELNRPFAWACRIRAEFRSAWAPRPWSFTCDPAEAERRARGQFEVIPLFRSPAGAAGEPLAAPEIDAGYVPITPAERALLSAQRRKRAALFKPPETKKGD